MPAYALAYLLDSGSLGQDAMERLHGLLADEGADLTTLLSSGAQVPLRWFREIYPGMDADQAACFAYAAGEQVRLTSFSLLTVPLVSAGSVNDALRLLEFAPLISNVFSARFFSQDDRVLIMLTVNSGDAILDRLPVLYCAGALVRLLKLLSDDVVDFTVHVAWPDPPGLRSHSEFIAGRLRFNAPMHYISIPRETMEVVCRFPDPVVYENSVNALKALLVGARMPDEIPARVKFIIDKGVGLIPIDEVARELNFSVSTLKRRLADSGKSFHALREEVLRDRAMLMLMDPSLSLDKVSSEVGYGDLSNFSHAFKRWTGETPGSFRRRAIDKLVS